jgi:hypothetical protein
MVFRPIVRLLSVFALLFLFDDQGGLPEIPSDLSAKDAYMLALLTAMVFVP